MAINGKRRLENRGEETCAECGGAQVRFKIVAPSARLFVLDAPTCHPGFGRLHPLADGGEIERLQGANKLLDYTCFSDLCW